MIHAKTYIVTEITADAMVTDTKQAIVHHFEKDTTLDEPARDKVHTA